MPINNRNASTTVVVPTLYKCQEIFDLNLDRLLDQNCIVHIIDNTPNNLCRKYDGRPNVKLSYFPSNPGVNHSWNIGVGAASTDLYILLNDDCLIWNNLIQVCEEILDDQNIGLTSFNTLTSITPIIYDSLYANQLNRPYEFQDMGPGHPQQRMGWIIVGRVNQYTPIPNNLRMLFGDDFLYKVIRKSGLRTVLEMTNPVFHKVSHTIGIKYTTRDYSRLFHTEELQFRHIEKQYGLGKY